MKFRLFMILSALLFMTSCTTALKPDRFKTGRLIYRSVPLQPGAAAWSPDSSRIAVITHGSLSIFDTTTDEKKVVSGISPFFLNWSPGENLLAVHKAGDRNELVKINAVDLSVSRVPLKDSPAAAKWFQPPDEFIVLFSDVNTLSFGTSVSYRYAYVYQGLEKTFLNWSANYLSRIEDIDLLKAWTYAGIRPLHETVLTPEFHAPPVVLPYTLMKTIDPLTGNETEILRLDLKRNNVPSAWSPDGSRLAVINDSGQLVIIDLENPKYTQPISTDVRGLYPSWNPEGSQIYLGGWLMETDGTVLEQLIPDAYESMGIWTPDGTGLSVLHDKALFHFQGFSP